MDWNGSLRSFVSRAEPSFNFLYNHANVDQFPGMEMSHVGIAEMGEALAAAGTGGAYGGRSSQEKKKRMTTEQLEELERSFQEEIKLEPERKQKLARDLGLLPRQIAVWFQNRRARWKTKQLERLYDALRHEFDLVSKEKQTLQDEVTKLRAMLRETARNQVSASHTEISGDETTVESTSIRSSYSRPAAAADNHHHHHQQMADCGYIYGGIDEHNDNAAPAVTSSYCWSGMMRSNNYP